HVSRTYRQSGGHRIRWFHHGLGRGVTPGDVARWCYWLASYDVGARGTYRYCAGGVASHGAFATTFALGCAESRNAQGAVGFAFVVSVFVAGCRACLRGLCLLVLDSF